MKVFLVYSLWSAFFTGQCKVYQEKIPTGFLKGAYSNSATLSGWIISPDSGFYAIKLANGYLTEVGKGKVTSFKDSVLSFQYDRNFQIPNRLNLSYYSYSRPNYDSIYIDIELIARSGTAFSQPPFVYYDNKLIGNTDSKGKFSTRLYVPKYTYPTSLAILGRSMGSPIIELSINPNVNYHTVKATVPGLDSTYCEVIGGSYDKNASLLTTSFKICNAPYNLKTGGFDKITQGSKSERENVITTLIKAKGKQPYLSQIIDLIVSKFEQDFKTN